MFKIKILFSDDIHFISNCIKNSNEPKNCCFRYLIHSVYLFQEVLSTVECYDPVSKVWEIIGSLQSPRSGIKAVVVDDKIFVLGGFNGTDRLKSVECFSPGLNRLLFHDVPDMIQTRSNYAVSVLEGNIFVSGTLYQFHQYIFYFMLTTKFNFE